MSQWHRHHPDEYVASLGPGEGSPLPRMDPEPPSDLLSLLKEALAAIEDEVDTMEEDSCLYTSYVACGRCEAGLPMPHSLAHRMQLAIMREEGRVSDGA